MGRTRRVLHDLRTDAFHHITEQHESRSKILVRHIPFTDMRVRSRFGVAWPFVEPPLYDQRLHRTPPPELPASAPRANRGCIARYCFRMAVPATLAIVHRAIRSLPASHAFLCRVRRATLRPSAHYSPICINLDRAWIDPCPCWRNHGSRQNPFCAGPVFWRINFSLLGCGLGFWFTSTNTKYGMSSLICFTENQKTSCKGQPTMRSYGSPRGFSPHGA